MVFPSGLPGGIHSDVLNASPATAEESQRLVEELKRRAKLAITSKRFPEAEVLYSKAIEILKVEGVSYEKDLSILYSNRSLCQLSVGKFAEARDDAILSTERDPSYVKAFFRLGSAYTKLGDPDGAVDAFQKALNIDPSNTALQKELSKAKKAQAEQKEIMEKKMSEVDNTKTVSEIRKSSANKAVKQEKIANRKVEKLVEKLDIDNSTGFTKSDQIRGYKIVNGKKTSYFHNEQTEEVKKLIGDITPKMIHASQIEQASNEKGVSAWNKAGTWEEKDVTPWARKALEKCLLSTTYEIPSECLPSGINATITVKKVKGLNSGHASIATVRGKRRNIFEFTNVEADWNVCLEEGGENCTGKLIFNDIDGTCDGEYDINYCVDNSTPGEAKHILDRFVKGDPDGLKGALIESVNGWIKLFSESF